MDMFHELNLPNLDPFLRVFLDLTKKFRTIQKAFSYIFNTVLTFQSQTPTSLEKAYRLIDGLFL